MFRQNSKECEDALQTHGAGTDVGVVEEQIRGVKVREVFGVLAERQEDSDGSFSVVLFIKEREKREFQVSQLVNRQGLQVQERNARHQWQ